MILDPRVVIPKSMRNMGGTVTYIRAKDDRYTKGSAS